MKKIKQATVILGGTLGGIVGGTLSFTGKLAKIDFLDSLGKSVVESALYTGEITGDFVSGVGEIAIGKIKKDKRRIAIGKKDLKNGTGKITRNYISNFKLIGGCGAEIFCGALSKDKVRVIKGGKKMLKIIAVGAMTVGAIKLDEQKPKRKIKCKKYRRYRKCRKCKKEERS